MAAFLANVGVNSSHAARSPLFDDGSFEVVAIPERQTWRPPMLRFRDVANATSHTPKRWWDRAIHLDPDLESSQPTYGDNCRRAGRAFSLRRAEPNDLIYFLARLQPAARPAGFYVVGCLEIEDVLADVAADPGPGWWDRNAHVRRARATCDWDSFWVFRGAARSGRFSCAVAFTRDAADAVFERTWVWRSSRTDLQTIGSYTRAVRRIESRGEEWLRTNCPS